MNQLSFRNDAKQQDFRRVTDQFSRNLENVPQISKEYQELPTWTLETVTRILT